MLTLQVFVPPTADELVEDWQQTWIVRVAKLVAALTIGWPLYLFFNVSGRKYERLASHFDPYSPIFSPRERLEILGSDAALGLVLTGLGGLARAFGWAWLLKACPRDMRPLDMELVEHLRWLGCSRRIPERRLLSFYNVRGCEALATGAPKALCPKPSLTHA